MIPQEAALKSDAYIALMDAKGLLNSVPLAKALGFLSGEMLLHGKTDDEVLTRLKEVFGDES